MAFLVAPLMAPQAYTEEPSATTGTLVVKVNVTDSDVYLDGGLVGKGPVTVNNLSPGLHQLTVLKDGYYAESMTVRVITGDTTTIRVNLTAMTGTIEVTGIPAGTAFIVVVGDKEYRDDKIEVAEDEWAVTIRVFGFKEQSERVRVRRRQNTVVEFKGEAAPFEARALAISRRSFNPDNPELLGCAELSFTVTAPGTGRVELRDGSGAVVRTIGLAPFATWKQRVLWDGTGDGGTPLPDGVYSLSVSVASADGQTALDLASAATIDRSIEYPFAGTNSGVGATGPVVSASLMPARSIQFGADAFGFSGTFGAGMSIVAGLTDWLETGARFATVTDGGEEAALDFAGGIKAGTRVRALKAGASLAWRARTAIVDGGAGKDRNGIVFGVPLECRVERVSFGIFPSIAFGDEQGLMGDAYFTAGAGAAVRADLGNVFLALYGNADSRAFGGGDTPSADGPIGAWSTGASVRAILPSTSVLISLEGGYAKSAGERGGAYASGGIGIVF